MLQFSFVPDRSTQRAGRFESALIAHVLVPWMSSFCVADANSSARGITDPSAG
ncbi:hypothetical protein [Nocardia sp. NPDC051981]|uniref:hypothetical protein n=1 Tax=Nocardia sp. NPDC051981 TaxID=3155417 RepID=UPI00343F5E22